MGLLNQEYDIDVVMKELEYAMDMDKLDELIEKYGIEHIYSILDEWKQNHAESKKGECDD